MTCLLLKIVMKDKRIFVFGDSRTGTMSLHKYFLALGIKSIHYFEKIIDVKDNRLSYFEKWKKVKEFISSSGFMAFSDYPTRIFYKEIYESFPSSYFILTHRKSVETWKNSIGKVFYKA